MKAPSVREGSKENGTLVTGNQIYKGCLVRQRTLTGQAFIQWTIANSLDSALRDDKKFVNRFMAGKAKIMSKSRSAKIPPVSIAPRSRSGKNLSVSITVRRREQTF